MLLFIAEAAAGGGLNIQGQLPGGNGPRANNGHQHRRQEQVLDNCPAHEHLPFRRIVPRIAAPERHRKRFEEFQSHFGTAFVIVTGRKVKRQINSAASIATTSRRDVARVRLPSLLLNNA
jgi:hypothetical protein